MGRYIIRTDIMYRRTPPICTAAADVRAFELHEEARQLAGALHSRVCVCEYDHLRMSVHMLRLYCCFAVPASGAELEAAKLFRKCFKMSPALADIYGC